MNLFKKESLYHFHTWTLTFLFLLKKKVNLKINSLKIKQS